MAEQKWFALPAEYGPGYFDVIRWIPGGAEVDDDHDGTLESAQARADQLNKGEGK